MWRRRDDEQVWCFSSQAHSTHPFNIWFGFLFSIRSSSAERCDILVAFFLTLFYWHRIYGARSFLWNRQRLAEIRSELHWLWCGAVYDSKHFPLALQPTSREWETAREAAREAHVLMRKIHFTCEEWNCRHFHAVVVSLLKCRHRRHMSRKRCNSSASFCRYSKWIGQRIATCDTCRMWNLY